MCLFPAMPRFAPAGLWEPCCSPAAMLGSGHLMETFIPSAPLHHWAGLSKNASCSPHPAPALPAELWFLHPSTGLPQGGHLRSDAEPQPHGMGSSGWTRVSWGGLLPGDGACSSASHTKPTRLPITYCRDPKITGTASHASWGLGDAQLLSSGKLNLGLFLDKIINTVLRRADLHLGLCLQTCPVPAGPALASASKGKWFWLRQGALSATLSPTAGLTGKGPPGDIP